MRSASWVHGAQLERFTRLSFNVFGEVFRRCHVAVDGGSYNALGD